MVEEILKVKDVCRILKISRTTVYELIKSGQLQASYINVNTKFRKHPRFTMRDLMAFMEKNKVYGGTITIGEADREI